MKISYDEEGYGHHYVYDNAGNLKEDWNERTDENNIPRQHKIIYQYDKFGKNRFVSDLSTNNTTEYRYDDLGRLIEVINGLNEATVYEYDNLDKIIKQTTAGGSITERYYDELGRLSQEKDPLQKSEYTAYDANGNILKKKDRNGTIFSYIYDDLNRLKTVNNDTTSTVIYEYAYDTTGNMTSAKNAQGITSYEYYDNGKLKKEASPDTKYIYYEYGNNGSRSKMIDHFGKETLYGYDLRGRLKTVTIDGKTTIYEYYNDGAREYIQYPDGIKEEYFYDEINNLTRLVNRKADGTIINEFNYTYDEAGNQLTKTDKNGKTEYSYDVLNRVKTVFNPDNTKIKYDYDKNGNVDGELLSKISSGTESNLAVTDYVYDSALYRLSHIIKEPVELSTLSVSPADSYLFAEQEVTFTLSGTMSNGSIVPDVLLNNAVWTTDSPTFILSATKGKTVVARISKAAWDSMDASEVIKIRATIGELNCEANIKRNIVVELIITPSEATVGTKLRATLTLSGEMSDGSVIPDDILNVATWTSSPYGLQLSSVNGKSITVSLVREYETRPPKGLIFTLNASVQGKTAQAIIKVNSKYSSIDLYKTLACVTSKPNDNEILTIHGDAGDRNTAIDIGLANVEITNPEENIISSNIINTKGSSVTEGGTQEIDAINYSTTNDDFLESLTIYYKYDNNGNIIEERIVKASGEEVTSYTYNEINQLMQLANPSGTTTYTYNPSGLRETKTNGGETTKYYYDGQNVIIETINNNFSAGNIFGINPIARETNSSKLYYLYNGHADVVAMVDSSGNVINLYDYDIYGKIREANESGIENPIRYAGQYYDDESDKYYLRARYYDPGLMRFISEDTNRGDVKDPLSLNLYVYCVGNPIKHFDPTGHAPGELFRSIEDAAYDFGLTYNEESIEAHQEYGSSIYVVGVKEIMDHDFVTGVDFKNTVVYYSYTKPNIGHSGNSVFPSITLKRFIVSNVHTHANYAHQYKLGNDQFSEIQFGDTWWADISGTTIYLVNPKGELRIYKPGSEQKEGELIRSGLPHDPFHPDWKKKDLIIQMLQEL